MGNKTNLAAEKKDKFTAINNKERSAHGKEQTKRDLPTEFSFYYDVVEKQSDLVCRCDNDARLIYVNGVFCDRFGQTKNELLGKSILQLIARDDRRWVTSQWRQYTRSNPQSTLEFRMIMPDNSNPWYSWTVRALFEMGSQIVGYQAVGRDISQQKKAEETINYLKYHDPLTGVFNRAFLNKEMKRLDHGRYLPISIIVSNINGLKLVNDTFGYPAGDRLLANTARILQKCCHREGIIVRSSGDQFVILLPNTPVEEAGNACEKIQAACLEATPDPIQPSLALGAATKDYLRKNLDEVLGEAEDVMFRAKLLESRSTKNSLISSLETTLHEKTTETREHAERLQYLSLEFGKALGLAADALDRLALLAKLHDIGKIAIPEEILTKPGPLNDLEWEIIRKHPEIGYRITQSSRELAILAEEVLAHHERWDGTGYPQGLPGERIPLLARILSIIDAFDVMTHERSYKTAISRSDAMDEIMRCSGSQFDPQLVKTFAQMVN